MKILRRILLALLLVVVPFAAIGCGKGGDNKNDNPQNPGNQNPGTGTETVSYEGEYSFAGLAMTASTKYGSSVTVTLEDAVRGGYLGYVSSNMVPGAPEEGYPEEEPGEEEEQGAYAVAEVAEEETEVDVIDEMFASADEVVEIVLSYLNRASLKLNADGSFDLGLDVSGLRAEGSVLPADKIYISQALVVLDPSVATNFKLSDYLAYEISEEGVITFDVNLTDSMKTSVAALGALAMEELEGYLDAALEELEYSEEEVMMIAEYVLGMVAQMDLLSDGVRVAVDTEGNLNLSLTVDLQNVYDVVDETLDALTEVEPMEEGGFDEEAVAGALTAYKAVKNVCSKVSVTMTLKKAQ